MSLFSSLFGKSDPDAQKLKAAERYEKGKLVAQSGDKAGRLKLAKDPKTSQELLYYLAENDKDADVRRAVAGNAQTPYQASPILSQDSDQDVRMALAERLVRLLPQLSSDKQSQLYAFSIQALGNLALDEVLKIRTVLSTTLKDNLHAPPKVVGQLARDIERTVSEPILRFCVALADEDLLDILSGHPESWAVQAIAGRDTVSEAVSQAVIDAEDVPAGLILLENKNAAISPKTLTKIVEKSRNFPQWQKPVVMRKNLTAELARMLASFVDDTIRDLLLANTDLDKETMDEISTTVRRRLEFIDRSENAPLPATDRVRKMVNEGTLNEDVVGDALGVRDRDFVIAALAALTRTNKETIDKLIQMRAPKPILAVCWKAGLSMRMAFQMQKELAMVPTKELIYPRGGTDYPLEKEELEWQLEFLGLAK